MHGAFYLGLGAMIFASGLMTREYMRPKPTPQVQSVVVGYGSADHLYNWEQLYQLPLPRTASIRTKKVRPNPDWQPF